MRDETRSRSFSRPSGWGFFSALIVASLLVPTGIHAAPKPQKKEKIQAAAADARREDSTGSAKTTKSAGPLRFAPGERLSYDITVLGSRAGRGVLTVGKERDWKGMKVIPLIGSMESDGVFSNVYPVKSKMLSLMPVDGSYPLHTEMKLDQNKFMREMTMDFDHAKGRVEGTKKENGGEAEPVKVKAPAYVQDMLTWFYHIRSYDLDTGKEFSFKSFSGKFFYTVSGKVTTQEDVWTPTGFIHANRIEATIKRDGQGPPFERRVTFWYGTDDTRLPVKMEFDFPLGRVQGILTGARVASRSAIAEEANR